MKHEVRRIDPEVINLDRCYRESDRQMEISRRQQALLAAADESEPHRNWYVLVVLTRHEQAVQQSLQASGIEAWVPVAEIIPPRRSGRKKQRQEPVQVLAWPGYAFVKVRNTPAAWAGLAGVKSVLGVIGTAERPAPVAENEVNALKVFLENDPKAFHEFTDDIPIGEMVRIKDGPFTGFNAPVLSIDYETGHLHVEVQLFGRSNTVALELAQIERG